ncbi:MAG TPA: hypothetical protein VD794_00255, partial [Flavisolibacter sp.]|nr:hypothetical protein [Flavisolibacter sp.]
TFFRVKANNLKGRTVSFGLSKEGGINLIIRHTVIKPSNKMVGGYDLEVGSQQLDSALAVLHWTNETVIDLKNKLARTNCDWIRTTEIYGKPVELFPRQSGWGSYAYRVFERPLPDSLLEVHGLPLSESDFGKTVFLDYSSVL